MSECCRVLPDVSTRQRRALRIVLGVNLAMFLLEAGAGLYADSTALLADSADMLGDALVYGVSLYAVGRGADWRARAATFKGWLMATFAAAVLVQAALTIARGALPQAPVMGAVGFMALGANVVCLILLGRRRADDVNMRSAWLCSRNDVVANVGVLAAAGAVALTGSGWPDVLVGLAIAALFGGSAARVLRDARRVREAAGATEWVSGGSRSAE
ncbi:MAG TPA: cation transporter [Methylomirabilota bacterium]|nr:cation transporter [Methylomirabilota bacterium]